MALPAADVRELLDSAPAEATVDLETQTVTLPSGRGVSFDVDPGVRERLLNGWDDIALTERRAAEIDRYEAERERAEPRRPRPVKSRARIATKRFRTFAE